MKLQSYYPHPALRDYVLAYTYAVLETPSFTQINFFPNKITSLSLILTQNPYVKSLENNLEYNNVLNFTGQHVKSVLYQSKSIEIINIVFKPWGAHALLGIPQHYLINENSNALEIYPELRNIVNELQDHHMDPLYCIRRLEVYLLKKLAAITKFDRRISFTGQLIEKNLGKLPIKELCSLVGMSKTSLEDAFKEKIGYSPKTYSRITRFNACLEALKIGNITDWQELVVKYNYYDQNHFIKEFKSFYGATPTKAASISLDISDFAFQKEV